MFSILLEVTSKNLLLSSMPESFDLLVFGGALILFAVGLRRWLNRKERVEVKRFSANVHSTSGKIQNF